MAFSVSPNPFQAGQAFAEQLANEQQRRRLLEQQAREQDALNPVEIARLQEQIAASQQQREALAALNPVEIARLQEQIAASQQQREALAALGTRFGPGAAAATELAYLQRSAADITEADVRRRALEQEVGTQRSIMAREAALRGLLTLRSVRDRETEAGRPAAPALAAAIDRVGGPLGQALGLSPEQLSADRQQILDDPAVIDDLLAQVQGQAKSFGGGVQLRDVIDPATGRPVIAQFLPTGEIVPTSFTPVAPLQREEALRLREEAQDPSLIGERAGARTFAQAQAEEQFGLPESERLTADSLSRIDEIRSPELRPAVEAVFGLPGFRSIGQGGLGALGAIPGTPAADAANRIEALVSQLRLTAFERLKGAGQITEKESEFAANAMANLDRAQSPDSFFRELSRVEAVLRKADAVSRLRAVQERPGAQTNRVDFVFNPKTGRLEPAQ